MELLITPKGELVLLLSKIAPELSAETKLRIVEAMIDSYDLVWMASLDKDLE